MEERKEGRERGRIEGRKEGSLAQGRSHMEKNTLGDGSDWLL